jgi:shikimate kinase
MNIVLIGYRGVGKSAVAKLLGERLPGWGVVSTDAEIVARAKSPIPDIVKEFGWEHFRDLESAVCREVAARDRQIIDTGGGAILRPENVEALKRNGRLFWLTAEVPTIHLRIGGDTQRPSLTGTKTFLEEIAEVLESRRPRYQAAADTIIPTDNQTLTWICDRIQQGL